jgi:hypothetical protein
MKQIEHSSPLLERFTRFLVPPDVFFLQLGVEPREDVPCVGFCIL